MTMTTRGTDRERQSEKDREREREKKIRKAIKVCNKHETKQKKTKQNKTTM